MILIITTTTTTTTTQMIIEKILERIELYASRNRAF